MALISASDLTDTATIEAYSIGSADSGGHRQTTYAAPVTVSCRVDVEINRDNDVTPAGQHAETEATMFLLPTETIKKHDIVTHNGTRYTVVTVDTLHGWDSEDDHLEVRLRA